jgi:MoaA/NifB/PqqE/SkfB family radical SAM enzyme
MNWRLGIARTALAEPHAWRIFGAAVQCRDRCRNRFRRSPPLRTVAVEVTNHCNLSCVMCPNRRISRQRGFMAPEVFDRLARGLPAGALDEMVMFGVGEPLLHPELPSLLRSAAARADRLALSTNAVALRGSHALAEQIMDSGINHLHVSADGYDAASYEAIRQGASFRDFLANLEILRTARNRRSPALPMILSYCLVREHSLEEMARVLEAFAPYVDAVFFKPLNNQSHPDIAYRPSDEVMGLRFFRKRPIPCPVLWMFPTVLWDGSVSACCRDHDGDFVVGDLSRQSLPEIWRGSALRRLRGDHLAGRFPGRCRECSQPREDFFRAIEINKRICDKLGRPWRGLLH